MDELRKQGLFYYYDGKYSQGHKFHEQTLFHIDGSSPTSSKDRLSDEAPEFEDTQPTPPILYPVAPSMESNEPVIYFHALVGISSPHTLKIKGYIKHMKVVVFIDITKRTHGYLHNLKIYLLCH